MDSFFEQPHSLTGLAIMLAILVQQLAVQPASRSLAEDLRSGVFAASCCFLVYASIMLQDGQLSRPHPVVWRVVHGATLLYLVFIIFLLVQSNQDNTDIALQLFEPRAGTAELPRLLHDAVSCKVTVENLWDRVDIFFLAHLGGWFIKALILRDWGLMWTCSLLFEVLEVTFQNAIPNFRECWWDRWLYDVFGCNLLGMLLGMRFAQWLGAREFDWSGTRRIHRIKRVALAFTPRAFPRRFAWHVFSSWKRFGVAFLVVFGILLGELNGFFLKSALRIPTDANVNIFRVVLMVPAIYASVLEMYAYAEDSTPRVGQTAWLVIALGVLEFLLSAKNFRMRGAFRPDQLRLDPTVKLAWESTLILAATVAAAKVGKFPSYLVKFLGRVTPLPLLLLLLKDSWENS